MKLSYTKNELIKCLKGRLKRYEEALEYKNFGTIPPHGFPVKNGNPDMWYGAILELEYILMLLEEQEIEKYV